MVLRMANCGLSVADCGPRLRSRRGKHRAHSAAGGVAMILTIVFVCLILWFLGLMTSTTLGGVLHVLLVIAIVLFLVHIIQGRSIGA
jgi:uncharacterized membrane protein YozB (DUF420 family)